MLCISQRIKAFRELRYIADERNRFNAYRSGHSHIEREPDVFRRRFRSNLEQFQQNLVRSHGHHVPTDTEIFDIVFELKPPPLHVFDQCVQVVGLNAYVMVRSASTFLRRLVVNIQPAGTDGYHDVPGPSDLLVEQDLGPEHLMPEFQCPVHIRSKNVGVMESHLHRDLRFLR